MPIEQLTPRQIVAKLDEYIVGQTEAKKAVAVALRNRFRRQSLPQELRDDVTPKNILMIGPTGVGKTEIARRLAQMARAPFVKVEATKFTEIGYVGRDVDSMVRDLASTAVRLVESEKVEEARPVAQERAMERLVDIVEQNDPEFSASAPQFGLVGGYSPPQAADADDVERQVDLRRKRIRSEIENGVHDRVLVEVESEEQGSPFLQVFSNQGLEEMGLDINSGNSPFSRTRRVYRKMPVKDALPYLIESEAKMMIDQHSIYKEALHRAEQTGIIFIDEIDKVAIPTKGAGPDVSREGVQRDLLPVIEGATVPTKFGPLSTEHILFICAGAFHESSPSDLIPELQGRLPIRVVLDALSEDDLARILKEPRNALTKQYQNLLAVDGVEVVFDDGALDEIAHMAAEFNEKTENIGARRLHTMLERLLGDVLYSAPESGPQRVEVTPGFVRERLAKFVDDSGKPDPIL